MDDSRWFSSMRHAQEFGFALKRITFQCIRNGDVKGMAAMFAPKENMAAISGALSDDFEHAIIACLFTWAQAEYAAVAGGVSEEEGSALFYVYARRAFEAHDVATLLELDRQILIDFAEAVDERLKEEGRFGPVNAAKHFIDERLYGGVTARQVADHLHFSVDYLSKLFNETCGMTLSAYIRNRKIEDAKALLEGSPLEIGEISGRLGFGTHSHFTSVFSKTVGMTPREYRAHAIAQGVAQPSAKQQIEEMVSRVSKQTAHPRVEGVPDDTSGRM